MFKVNHLSLSAVQKVAATGVSRTEPNDRNRSRSERCFHQRRFLSYDGGSKNAAAADSPGAGSASPPASPEDAAPDVSVRAAPDSSKHAAADDVSSGASEDPDSSKHAETEPEYSATQGVPRFEIEYARITNFQATPHKSNFRRFAPIDQTLVKHFQIRIVT